LISGESLPVINYFSEMFNGIESSEINSFKREDVLLKTKKCFEEKQRDEIMRGISLIGPQRDDYIFILNKRELSDKANFEMKNFASQGEHKTFVLALKLAEYYYIKDKVSTSPVLLLDDILSELDSSRVLKIMLHLNDFGQIFLTSTERNYFDELKKLYKSNEISLYKIENGNAEPKEN
jgi:DNA replication and repair protein RecF